LWYNEAMQTVKQSFCVRCRELNAPFLSACAYCGAPLDPAVHFLPPLDAEPLAPSDLPPLLWALVCLFLALWGLVAAGPIHGLLSALTHPALLIACAMISLILTGMFLAERVSKEPKPRALLSVRDLMALSWTTAALLAATQSLKYILPSMPVITRYEIMRNTGDGCRVEVYIKGEDGDEMWRLTGLNRKSEKEIVGIIVRRPGGGSARLPTTEHTAQGDCAIAKYHLMVNGKETDQVDGVDPQ
jgi:hypothetical protein